LTQDQKVTFALVKKSAPIKNKGYYAVEERLVEAQERQIKVGAWMSFHHIMLKLMTRRCDYADI